MEEEKNYKLGFDWKNIFIKVILLILFIILIIWLFPNKNIDTFYDSVFNNNIQTMKEAARNYFTVDRLPTNIGESTTLTLQEMLDKHMLLEFRDKNNNTCSTTESFVQVTKSGENEYVLKVQLSCGKQKDYILDTIGCYDVCVDGECTTIIDTINPDDQTNSEYEIEYEFKQQVASGGVNYTCPSGYTLNDTKCYKNGTQTINATVNYSNEQKIENALKNESGSYLVYTDPLTKNGTLKCPTGYTSNGIQCVKTYNASVVSSSGQYTCDSGYTLSGTKCYKTYSATYNSGAISYTCPSGYTLSGTTCYKSYNASYQSGATSYYCPNGGVLQGTKCVYTASYKAGTTTYTCPYGNKSGTNCIYTPSTSTGSTNYTCPYGTVSGSNCIYKATATSSYGAWYVVQTYSQTTTMATYSNATEKLVYNGITYKYTCGTPSLCPTKAAYYNYTKYRRNVTTNYSCPYYNAKSDGNGNCVFAATKSTTGGGQYCPYYNATLTNGSCVFAATKSTSAGTYYCPYGGNLSGTTQCSYNASKSTGSGKYYCPNGGTLNNTTCVISIAATKKTGTGSYTCPSGGELNGSICKITINAKKGQGSTVLSCPYGGTLSGSKCTNYLDGVSTTVYYCPSGYTTSGSGASTTCYKKVTSNSTYYCKDANATLKDGKCYLTVKTISGYTCPSGYSLNGTKCTKNTATTINATINSSNGTSYRYTWSKQTYLDGWIATGKTRTVAKTITNDGK